MGDNRDNSLDSRVQSAVGFVPIDNLVGRAEFIFFSVDGSSPIWQVWNWPFAIRWSRLLSPVR
jgi:signal peptidase I